MRNSKVDFLKLTFNTADAVSASPEAMREYAKEEGLNLDEITKQGLDDFRKLKERIALETK